MLPGTVVTPHTHTAAHLYSIAITRLLCFKGAHASRHIQCNTSIEMLHTCTQSPGCPASWAPVQTGPSRGCRSCQMRCGRAQWHGTAAADGGWEWGGRCGRRGRGCWAGTSTCGWPAEPTGLLCMHGLGASVQQRWAHPAHCTDRRIHLQLLFDAQWPLIVPTRPHGHLQQPRGEQQAAEVYWRTTGGCNMWQANGMRRH